MDDYRFSRQPDEGYYARISRILDKARNGQPLEAGERQILDASLQQFAPADPMYRRVAGTVGRGQATYDPAQDSVMPPGRGITSGIPATDPNLEATLMTHDKGMPYNPDAEPEIGGLPLPKSQAQKDQLAQMLANMPQGSSGLTANSALGYGSGEESPDVLSYFYNETQGTPFANMSPGMAESLVSNPQVLAHIMAQQEGAGPNAETFLEPRIEAALALAGTGMLGRGSRGKSPLPGLDDAPVDDLQKLLAAQEFMDQFNQPGTQFVDVNALYQEAFNRASNTDLRGQTDQNGRPVGIEGEIQLTNEALLAAAPFMSQESQAWISSALQSAAVEYMAKITTGEISMSYPNYLRSIGIDQMLAGA